MLFLDSSVRFPEKHGLLLRSLDILETICILCLTWLCFIFCLLAMVDFVEQRTCIKFCLRILVWIPWKFCVGPLVMKLWQQKPFISATAGSKRSKNTIKTNRALNDQQPKRATFKKSKIWCQNRRLTIRDLAGSVEISFDSGQTILNAVWCTDRHVEMNSICHSELFNITPYFQLDEICKTIMPYATCYQSVKI